MDWITEPFSNEHIRRGMLICVLVGFTNGYFSAFVVLRKSALQVGSLSHSLLPGIGVGILLFGLSQASAFAGALVRRTDRRSRQSAGGSEFETRRRTPHWRSCSPPRLQLACCYCSSSLR